MKKFLLLVVAATIISSLSFATIRRVGYSGIQSALDYTSINAANSASVNGDTLQIYGIVGTGTISKRLVIIGFGYNFDVHPNLQVMSTTTPSYAVLNFAGGSDSSIVFGLSGSFTIQPSTTQTVSNITFRRCYGDFAFNNYTLSSGLISNIAIISSVITGGGCQYDVNHVGGEANLRAVTNISVLNSYIYNFNLYKLGTSGSFVNCVMPALSMVGAYALNLNQTSCLVSNCIFIGSGSAANINTVYENNFFVEAQPAVLPFGSNNRWGQDYAVLFNRISTANNNASFDRNAEFDENYFVLKAGSPAINGGFAGPGIVTDCGIFGGGASFAYKISGVPPVPSIYKLTAPTISATANPYNVTISVRSNN